MTGDMPDLRALAKELGRPLGTPRVLGSLSNFGMIGGRFASLVVVMHTPIGCCAGVCFEVFTAH